MPITNTNNSNFNQKTPPNINPSNIFTQNQSANQQNKPQSNFTSTTNPFDLATNNIFARKTCSNDQSNNQNNNKIDLTQNGNQPINKQFTLTSQNTNNQPTINYNGKNIFSG